MKNKTKQTSIDWLLDRIDDVDLTPELWDIIKEKAKSMHKEEIIAAADANYTYNNDGFPTVGQMYYNETFTP